MLPNVTWPVMEANLDGISLLDGNMGVNKTSSVCPTLKKAYQIMETIN